MRTLSKVELARLADENLKQYGNLNRIDIIQMFTDYKQASFVIQYLNSKNNYINTTDDSGRSLRVWYYKPLKEYTCAFCGRKFKSPSTNKFCSNPCRTRYLYNKEHEINFLK